MNYSFNLINNYIREIRIEDKNFKTRKKRDTSKKDKSVLGKKIKINKNKNILKKVKKSLNLFFFVNLSLNMEKFFLLKMEWLVLPVYLV